MSRITGKDLEVWWDGAEVPATSANLSAQFDTVDSTDTATPGTGKDVEIIRAARTFTVEAELYEPDGAEVATGTLTAGTRYRVTAGTITETGGTYTVGMIFESDGTGTASTNNKVKPLGARVTGKDMALTYNSADVPLTEADFSVKFNELDVTDSSTSGDAKETEVSRADRESKVTGIVRDTVADLLTTAPVKHAAELALSANVKVSGYAVLVSKNVVDNVNDVSKIDYSLKWLGSPTETALGIITGTSKAFKIILKRGSSTNKEYTGTAVLVSKTIKAGISGLATVSYGFTISGALTENVAS